MQTFYNFALKVEAHGLSGDALNAEIHAFEKEIEFAQMDERVYNHLINKSKT
jgi:hypothetical protein